MRWKVQKRNPGRGNIAIWHTHQEPGLERGTYVKDHAGYKGGRVPLVVCPDIGADHIRDQIQMSFGHGEMVVSLGSRFTSWSHTTTE